MSLCRLAASPLRANTNSSERRRHSLVRPSLTADFEVELEIVVKVYNIQKIGEVVDELQKIGVKKFNSFAWKSDKVIRGVCRRCLMRWLSLRTPTKEARLFALQSA